MSRLQPADNMLPLRLALMSCLLSAMISSAAFAQNRQTTDSLPAEIATLEVSQVNRFLTPADTFNQKRFWMSTATAGAVYTGFAVGLWEAWYKGYDIGKFKLIDDRREWEFMDKLGHGYTAYHYTRWADQGLKWSGTPRTRRLLMAGGTSLLLQSTVEVMDGFSQAWGFSWADMGLNASGVALYVGQDLLFREQRVRVKFSAFRQNHSQVQIPSLPEGGPSRSLQDRADDLYGKTAWQRFIKDYNGQTVWLATNPAVLAGFGESAPLPWLMLAVGYSPRNVYGAYGNGWAENGYLYLGDEISPRRRDMVLSVDIDFERIPTRSPLLKTVFHLLNHMKFPAPALILNQHEGPRYRWIYY